MFDIGWSELLVIAVVAVVVIGPKDLPRVLRTLGQWTGRMKRMARDFQRQFDEAIREAELDAVQRDIEEIGKIDPLADIRDTAAKTGRDITADLDRVTREPVPPPMAAPSEVVPPVAVPVSEAVAPEPVTAAAAEPKP